MKNLKITLTLLVTACLFSCKKEMTETETINQIKTDVLKKNITKEDFNKTVFPLVEELYKKDSVKYKMIAHISNKAKIQNDKEIFKMNLDNLKSELQFVK